MASIDKGPVPTGLFIQSLNEIIKQSGKRLSAARNRIPSSVLVTLFGIVAVAGAFSSYPASARDAERARFTCLCNGDAPLSAVIFLIINLIDRARFHNEQSAADD